MSEWWLDLFYYLSLFTYLLSAGLLIAHKKDVPKNIFALLLAYLVVSVVTEIGNLLLIYIYHLYSCYINSIYVLVSGVLVLLLYRNQLNTVVYKTLNVILLISFIAVAFIQIYRVYFGIDLTSDIGHIYKTVLTLSLALLYFFQSLLKPTYNRIQEETFFWINNAFFIYSGISLFLLLFKTFIISEEGNMILYSYLWPIINFATIIFNLLIIRAVWKKTAPSS